MALSVDIRSAFRPSAALAEHVERSLSAALDRHARRVRRIEVRLFDDNGPRGGTDDKVTSVTVLFHRGGPVVATACDPDVYASVSRAAARVKTAVDRRMKRLKTFDRVGLASRLEPSAGGGA